MSKRNGGSVEPAAPIVVMASREVPIGKLYGGGGARDTRRFLEEVKAAWQAQGYRSDQESRGILWAHLGEEVRQEMNCVLDGDTWDPQRLFQAIKKAMASGGAFPRCWVCSRAPNRNTARRYWPSLTASGAFSTLCSHARGRPKWWSRPVSFYVTTLPKTFTTPSSVASSEIILRWTQRRRSWV